MACPNHIAVIICARNEEPVIGQLIDSLNKQDYPKDCYRVFVVAHNCSDATAAVASNSGATVFVRNAAGEGRKTQALQYGLDCIKRDYGSYFSHFAVFDADCLVHRDFLKEINNALALGADVASGYYSSKNFEDSIVSRLSGTLYSAIMHITCIPHGKLGLPVNVYGSGYAAKMVCGEDIGTLTTLVGDFEFSTRLVMRGAKLVFAPKAIIYAEMPVTLRDALIQRRRWALGDSQCFRKYSCKLLCALPSLGWSGVKQFMDIIMNPTAIFTFSGIFFGGIILWYAGNFDVAVHFFLLICLVYCCVVWLNTAYTIKKDGRRLRENLLVCLLFPAWVLVTPLFAMESIFRQNAGWTPTKRVSTKRIEDMEGSGK